MKKTFLKSTYFRYTCLFLLLLPIIFLPFILEGKTFVWKSDGISQHYPLLYYYGELLKGLLSGKSFPMVDLKLGLGFDTISTLQYYALGDPISLLTVFITPTNEVYIYTILILLRFYLIGISFIVFCKYWKKDGNAVVLGALIYVFCGYTFYAGIRHPFFLNPLIYLPLIIIGLEQVLRRKKPYLIIVMSFISAISNFYFFYILTIIAVIYVIFRYFYSYKKSYQNTITGLIATGFRTGGYYLIGTAMAGVVFLPVIYAFIQNGRLNARPHMITGFLNYNFKYYLTIFQGLFAPGVTPAFWVDLSFASITLVSIIILLCNKSYKQLKIILGLSFLAIFIPSFGYFMNGFAYVSNRWDFLFSLLIAAIFVATYEKLFALGILEYAILFASLFVYGIFVYAFTSEYMAKFEYIILLLTVIVIVILQSKWFRDRRALQEFCVAALVIFTLGFHGFAYYSPKFVGYSGEFLTKAKVMKQGALSLIPNIKDNSVYRIETYGDKKQNEALRVGYHDVSGYFSLMDGDITNNFMQLELLNLRSAYRFDNFDNRTILDETSAVKYFVTTNKSAAPYGYQLLQQVKKGTKNYYLFQNSYALPLGTTYSSYMTKMDYDKLSSLEKQNALMNAVILDNDSNYAVKSNQDMHNGINKLNVKITPDNNVELGKNSIIVKKSGAKIRLDFDKIPNSETYIRLGNFNINKKVDTMKIFKIKGDNGVLKSVNVKSIYYNSYFGKENYLVNMGYSQTGEASAVITFPNKEKYSLSDLEVYSLDMSNYTKQAQALQGASLQNVKQGLNNIQGDITLDKKGIMALSIPYSKGWSAYVDGNKTEILRGNVMYMALPLEAGTHHIILKYRTPLLNAGCLVSVIAILIFIGIIIMNKRRTKY